MTMKRTLRILPPVPLLVLLAGAAAVFAAPPPTTAPPVPGEEEPNDARTSANVLPPGDTVSGALTPAGDVDWYRLDPEHAGMLVVDVEAVSLGAPGSPSLSLQKAHGHIIAYHDDSRTDAWVRAAVHPEAGPYFVALTGGASEGHEYRLATRLDSFAPGDPTKILLPDVRVNDLVSGSGVLYSAEQHGLPFARQHQIMRWSGAGRGVIYRAPVYELGRVAAISDMALDRSGDLVVLETDFYGDVSRLLRISAGFATIWKTFNSRDWYAVATDPEGSVWLTNGASLLRYSEGGQLLGETTLPGAIGRPTSLAFSPGGDLLIAADEGLFRASPVQAARGDFSPFYRSDSLQVTGMTFDLLGDLYVTAQRHLPEASVSEVWRISSGGELLPGPMATSHLHLAHDLVFLIAEDGSPTSRLLVANRASGPWGDPYWGLVELGAAGVPTPGPPGGSEGTLVVAAQQLLGGPVVLDEEAIVSLDARGNGNGRLDVGDLLALNVRLQGRPAADPAPRLLP